MMSLPVSVAVNLCVEGAYIPTQYPSLCDYIL